MGSVFLRAEAISGELLVLHFLIIRPSEQICTRLSLQDPEKHQIWSPFPESVSFESAVNAISIYYKLKEIFETVWTIYVFFFSLCIIHINMHYYVNKNSVIYQVQKDKREFYLSQTEDHNPGNKFLEGTGSYSTC